MAKGWFLFVFLIGAPVVNAQSVLTKQIHAPTVNDKYEFQVCDSTGALMVINGSNAPWDFGHKLNFIEDQGSFYQSFNLNNHAGMFPKCNLLEVNELGIELFLNVHDSSNGGELRWMGAFFDSIYLKYTDPFVLQKWPFKEGDSLVDLFSGVYSGHETGTINGQVTMTCKGSGLLTLRGSVTYPNVLQVVTVITLTNQISAPYIYNADNTVVTYSYFDPFSKFPLLSVYYETVRDPLERKNVIVKMRKGLNTGSSNADAEKMLLGSVIVPNPVQGLLEVNCLYCTEYRISDPAGRLLYFGTLNAGEALKLELQEGLYYLQLITIRGTINRKVLVVH